MIKDRQKWKGKQYLIENRHKIDEKNHDNGISIQNQNHGSGSGLS